MTGRPHLDGNGARRGSTRGRLLRAAAGLLLVVALSWASSCDLAGAKGGGEPAQDPSEYLYDVTATGSLTADGRSHAAVAASVEPFVEFSSRAFQEPALVVPRLKVSVRFADTGLCLFVLLERRPEGWRVSDANGASRHFFAYAPDGDGYSHYYDAPFPWSGTGATLRAEEDADRPGVLRSLTLDAGAPTRWNEEAPDDGIGRVDAVEVTLAFSAPRGHVAEDLLTSRDVDEVRNMDTRSWTRTVSAEILAGLATSPGDWVVPLVSHLTGGVEDPVVRLKILHDWVCEYVYADQPARQGEYAPPIGPFEVLRTRRALCAGQVRLLQYLAQTAGIGVRYIEGAVKYADYAGPADLENHAWAMVRVNGELRFIEQAWDGANVFTAGREWAAYARHSGWFLVEDDVLRVDHLPFKAAYSSSGTDMSLDEFLAAPYLPDDNRGGSSVLGCFHDAGYSLEGPLPSVIEVSDKAARVALSLDGEAAALYAVCFEYADADGDGADDYHYDWTFLQSAGPAWTLWLRPARAGTTRVYLRDRPDGQSRALLDLLVRTAAPAEVAHPFPRQYDAYHAMRAVLVSPLAGSLPAGSTVAVDVTVPGAERVAIGNAAGYSSLSCDVRGRAAGSWVAPATPGSVTLYAVADGAWSALAGYVVE